MQVADTAIVECTHLVAIEVRKMGVDRGGASAAWSIMPRTVSSWGTATVDMGGHLRKWHHRMA
ncbi:hypothetical protein B0920_17370 [Massilia sp. KIM]|nr:hypothetical protein B0920_17370 [Massilia sp. KIM]